ncbi:MAG: hypothetical protein ABS81_05280 [Pseudonocardia sp. SCN 72-86]|nr:MAG: hypothetical protein ABS81_05280 [Pseudonocardia sp. SCN 72-86]
MLAGLLRWSRTLAVHAALDAESYLYSTLLGGTEFRAWLDRRGPRPLPAVVAEPVRTDREGGELRVRLDLPERRNAYGRQMRDAPRGGAGRRAAGPVGGKGGPHRFGAGVLLGGDLDEFRTTPDPVTAHLVRTRHGAARPLHALRERVEVRVHGACVSAGIEHPAFAGRVVAAPGTTFRLPEVAMGLVPGAGGTVSIPRRIGRHRTLYLALSGGAFSASTALSWGLIDAITR